MSLTTRLSRVGAALFVALGLAACGGSDPSGTASTASGSAAEVSPAAPAAVPQSDATNPAEPQPAPPTTKAAAPATTAPKKPAPPTTAARSTPSPTTAAPAAPPTTTAVTPKFAPGQRINPTTAQVQGAISTLTQRIPLFKPNETQLRTFADAACTSFDQGQTFPQVSTTIRQAVTYVQGASLSVPDADFAVRTVVTLRCPGYLP